AETAKSKITLSRQHVAFAPGGVGNAADEFQLGRDGSEDRVELKLGQIERASEAIAIGELHGDLSYGGSEVFFTEGLAGRSECIPPGDSVERDFEVGKVERKGERFACRSSDEAGAVGELDRGTGAHGGIGGGFAGRC